MCITGGGGLSPYHGGVLTQHLDIYSGKIAVHSDRAIYRMSLIVCMGCPSKTKKMSLQAAVSGVDRYSPHASKSVHACNHEQLGPPNFPGSSNIVLSETDVKS